MESELNGVLVEYEKQAHNLFSCLSSAPLKAGSNSSSVSSSSTSTRVRSAVDSLVSIDTRLRNGIEALKEHQKAVKELNILQTKVVETEATLRGTMKNILDCEEDLVTAVNRAEALLERSKPQSQQKLDNGQDTMSSGGAHHSSMTPLAISEYANFIASTTSAPPEWRPWKPLLVDGRILPPNPKPEEVNTIPDWKGKQIPSMFRVSWIQPGFGVESRPGSAHRPSETRDAASLKSNQRAAVDATEKLTQKARNSENPPKRRALAGFSDDSDDD